MPLNSIGWTSISCQGCPALICCQQRSSSPQQQQWSYTQTRRWSGRADRSRSLALRCYAQQALTLSAADLERAGSAHSLQSLLAPDEAQARLLGSWAARGRHPQQDAAGRLLLKNLTYSELEEWCLATGDMQHHSLCVCAHPGLWRSSPLSDGARARIPCITQVCSCLWAETLYCFILLSNQHALSPSTRSCRRKAATSKASLEMDVPRWPLDAQPRADCWSAGCIWPRIQA